MKNQERSECDSPEATANADMPEKTHTDGRINELPLRWDDDSADIIENILITSNHEPNGVDEDSDLGLQRSPLGCVIRFFCKLIAVLLMIPWAVIFIMKWVPPPGTTFMAFHLLSDHAETIRYSWIDWSSIPPVVPLAVIAAEDQQFLEHHGFDFESIRRAWREHRAGIRTRGASTISQQVAKNLFLWPGKDVIRKAVEGYLTVIIELLWTKRRIIEVYVNIAEFAPGIYGVGAASEFLFEISPGLLTPEDAALMAAVLPNPVRLNIRNPSLYVLSRRDFIYNQMTKLGGVHLLEKF